MDNIYIAILGYIIGPVVMLLVNFLAKKYANTAISFDKTYYLPSLITMIATIISSPMFLWITNSINAVFLFVGTASIGFSLNSVINIPLTQMMKKNKAAAAALTAPSISDTTRRVIYAIVLVALIVGVGVASVYAVQTYQAKSGGHGKIKAIGIAIFSDSGGTVPCTQIDWGTLEPGQTAPATIYVKAIGNSPVTITMSTTNWVPAGADAYLTNTWNYDGSVIQPSAIKAITIQLSVSPSITGITDFSYDIVITATG